MKLLKYNKCDLGGFFCFVMGFVLLCCVFGICGFIFLVGNRVLSVRRVLVKPVSSTWNFTQTLSFLKKKEEEYIVRVKSCFSVSFMKHKSFEH